jgi:hypothetical protein
MIDASYVPYGLEPIEKASRDEITALQITRLKWSLRHAYDNIPAYKQKFDAAGVKTCATIIRSACSRSHKGRSRASMPLPAPPASRQ